MPGKPQERDGDKDGQDAAIDEAVQGTSSEEAPVEVGGPTGPEPTRYGDWERKGRCIDF